MKAFNIHKIAALSGVCLIWGCGSLNTSQLPGSSNNSETLKREISELEKLKTDFPTNSSAFLGLGWTELQRKNYPEAVSRFNQALKLNPYLARSYMGLGAAYFALDEPKFALESYKAALKLRPHWNYAYYQMGRIYHAIGNKKGYFEALDTLVIRDPNLANGLIKFIYRHQDES